MSPLYDQLGGTGLLGRSHYTSHSDRPWVP